ncbi:MAG: DUF3035 domain-containing protein [Acetobacteraceae bacterium]|nr:DUF3035 domain-containing protein [Acetobacteraceae bacterium]
MRIRSSNPFFALACGTLLMLAGCGGDQSIARTLGMVRDAPDEFTVTTRAPLVMPPSYDLPLPAPGSPRPQESPERVQAEQALVPESALAATPAEGQDSPGQEALVKLAGPPAPPHIRRTVNAESLDDQPPRSLTDRLMFWQSPPPPGTVVDASREAQRIRENAALGQPIVDGDTPIVQPKRKSILGSIDPF